MACSRQGRFRSSAAAAGLALLLALSAPAAPARVSEQQGTEQQVQAFVDEMATRHGMDRMWLEGLLGDARSRPEIIERISRPAERTLTWGEYRAIFLGAERIEEGARFMALHADTLARARDTFGVPAEYIVAILGVETRYGTRRGDWRVLDALYTLGFEYPPRMAFFRRELEQFLLLAQEEERDPRTLTGSYAGAMGWGQFISSSYRAYAVDFDDDGIRDIWENPVDAIGSVANYFAEHGWRADAPVLRAVSTGDVAALDGVANRGLDLQGTVGELRALGVQGLDDLPAQRAAGLWRVEGAEGEELYATFGNFRTITRYNHSHLYALAVHDLASAIRRAADAADAAKGS